MAPLAIALPSEEEDEEEEEEGDEGSCSAPPPVAPEKDSAAAVSKVVGFLRQMRGLHSLSSEDLEALINSSRFELLPPLKSGGTDGGKKRVLPFYSAIPTQDELHDLLLGGAVPGGYQAVASVLYPESIPWPIEEDEKRSALGSASSEEEGQSPSQRQHSTLSLQGTPRRRGSVSSRLSQGTGAGDRAVHHESCSSGNPGTLGGGSRKNEQISENRRLSAGAGTRDLQLEAGVEQPSAEVIVCGRKVSTTVRGNPVQQLEDPINAADEADDEKYNAAHRNRIGKERKMKLQQYEEKKLIESIQNLEEMKTLEIERQEAIRKREEQRNQRKKELKQQLDKDISCKIEEEKAAEELERQRKEKEAKAEKQRKIRHEQRKELLSQWHEEQATQEPISVEARAKLRQEARAKLRQQELSAQKLKNIEEREKKKTLKQIEAEEYVQRIQAACQERPPLPPRPHDLPIPVLDMIDEAGKPTVSARAPRLGRWKKQVEVVSSSYGLSEKEHSAVAGVLTRGVTGAGRMANYER